MKSKPTGPKGHEAVHDLLREILKDAPPGTQASARTEGEIERGPHPDKTGRLHEDNWEAIKNEDGSITISKEHVYPDDEESA